MTTITAGVLHAIFDRVQYYKIERKGEREIIERTVLSTIFAMGFRFRPVICDPSEDPCKAYDLVRDGATSTVVPDDRAIFDFDHSVLFD